MVRVLPDIENISPNNVSLYSKRARSRTKNSRKGSLKSLRNSRNGSGSKNAAVSKGKKLVPRIKLGKVNPKLKKKSKIKELQKEDSVTPRTHEISVTL